MSQGLHPIDEKDADKKGKKPPTADEKTLQELRRRKHEFEAQREMDGSNEETSVDSVAKNKMFDGGKVSEEHWEGHEDVERDNFVQEELYVHAKVLIADDRVAICGSANINDRVCHVPTTITSTPIKRPLTPKQSQLGSHDSEIAIVLQDTDLISSTMDSQPYNAGRYISSLRRALWLEHLGLLPAQGPDASNDPNALPPTSAPNVPLSQQTSQANIDLVTDPLSNALWETWTSHATTNTNTYRYLFRADPDDNIRTFEDFDNFSPRGKIKQGHLHDPFVPVGDVKEKLDEVRGHLVWMPLEFLRDADMATPGLSVNQITEVSLLCLLVLQDVGLIGLIFQSIYT